ncbi:TPR repeat containing protein [Beggiatoa sp. PS]|nr:TPR repeat containing protein [Beggiatoa sp. PS]
MAIILGPVHIKLLNRAKDSFLLLFPYEHPSHKIAIQILKETDFPYGDYAKTLLHSIVRHKWKIAYLECDNSQLLVWRKLQPIIISYYKNFKRLRLLFSILLVRLLLICIILYLSIFCECSWWTIFFISIGVFFIDSFVLKFLSGLLVIRLSRSLTKSFFDLFPENHSDYYVAIELLISFNYQHPYNSRHPFFMPIEFRRNKKIGSIVGDAGSILLKSSFERALEKGMSFFKQGDWKNAQKYLEDAVNLAQKVVDRGYQEKFLLLFELALARFYLGTCLLQSWELPAAIRELEKAQDVYRTLVSMGHETVRIRLAETQTSMAIGFGRIGDLLAEKKALQENIKEYQWIINEKNKVSPTTLVKIVLRSDVDVSAKSVFDRYKDYLGSYTKTNYELEGKLASIHAKLGVCFFKLGDIFEARQHLEKAQEYFQKWLDAIYPDLFKDEKKREENQAIIKTAYPQLSKGLALSRFDDVSVFCKIIEQYERLEEYLQRKSHRDNYWQKFKRIFKRRNSTLERFQKIEEHQKKVIKEDIGLFAELATARKYLGLCLQQSAEPSDLETVQKSFSNSVAEFMALAQIQPNLRPHFANALITLGDYHINRSEFFEARQFYETGVIEYQALIAEGHDELNKELNAVYISLGKCLQELEEFSEADSMYKKALEGLYELYRKGQIFSDEIRQIIAIIQWYNASKREDEQSFFNPFETALEGLDWLDKVLNQVSDTSKSDLIENNLELYRLSADFALQFNQPEQAYFILERSKSRVLVEQMLRERAEPGPHIDKIDEKLRPKYRELRERLRSLVNQLDTSTPIGIAGGSTTRFFTPTTRSIKHRPEQTKQLLEERQDIEEKLIKVRKEIIEIDAAFGEAIQPRTLTVKEIKSLIPANSLVIAFEQRPEFLYLYAITAQGIQTPVQIKLSLEQVQTKITQFTDEKIGINSTTVGQPDEKPQPIPFYRKRTANDLCQWLDTHLKSTFTQFITQFKPNQIILIPHVDWHLLPIHLVSINEELLALRYPVCYLPSLQILRLIHERPSAQQEEGCIIANPLGDLAGAEQESQTVYQLRAKKDKRLLREEATVAAVREALNNAQHSHFSCHGYFATDLKAGLRLADGELVAKEMFTSIRLDNPRLVVMSACETAQIQPTLADEYMGLSSSFLFAGAHNVLATLWRVDDNASRLLIEEFYQGLNDGLSPVKALQQAQRLLRQLSIDELYQRLNVDRLPSDFKNPYYWAGFILIGDGV